MQELKEENLVNLYHVFHDTRRTPDQKILGAWVLATIGVTAFSMLDQSSIFSDIYRELPVWGSNIAGIGIFTHIAQRLGGNRLKKLQYIAEQIGVLEGRIVGNPASDQVQEEYSRACKVMSLVYDTAPSLLTTNMFDGVYIFDHLVRPGSVNTYEYIVERDLQAFYDLGHSLEPRREVALELVRDGLMIKRGRLRFEAQSSKLSDKRRVYSQFLNSRIEEELQNLPVMM